MRIPTHVEERDSEWPLAAVLRVGLLDVAQLGHQLLTRHGLPVAVEVSLKKKSRLNNFVSHIASTILRNIF